MSRCEPEVIDERSPTRLRQEQAQGAGWVFVHQPPPPPPPTPSPAGASRVERVMTLARDRNVQLGIVTARISLVALAITLSGD
ncbi:MAG: hypothetical protein RL385_90 [Pseudomonadota bacterium]|jgi:phenylpropionate dioxygenase-like ring-hydroxylating dioxygenase large terminal subunit